MEPKRDKRVGIRRVYQSGRAWKIRWDKRIREGRSFRSRKKWNGGKARKDQGFEEASGSINVTRKADKSLGGEKTGMTSAELQELGQMLLFLKNAENKIICEALKNNNSCLGRGLEHNSAVF